MSLFLPQFFSSSPPPGSLFLLSTLSSSLISQAIVLGTQPFSRFIIFSTNYFGITCSCLAQAGASSFILDNAIFLSLFRSQFHNPHLHFKAIVIDLDHTNKILKIALLYFNKTFSANDDNFFRRLHSFLERTLENMHSESEILLRIWAYELFWSNVKVNICLTTSFSPIHSPVSLEDLKALTIKNLHNLLGKCPWHIPGLIYYIHG